MGSVAIGRINVAKDLNTEQAIQEVATEMGNNLQFGTDTPGINTPGKVYLKHATADSSGWAEVTTVYVNTKR